MRRPSQQRRALPPVVRITAPRSRIRVRRPDRLRPPRPVRVTDPAPRPPGRAVVPPAAPRPAARLVRVRVRRPPVHDRPSPTHRPRRSRPRRSRPRRRRPRPSRPRLRRPRHRPLRPRRLSRRAPRSRPPRRHRASRRPSSRRLLALPRRRVPVPYRGRRVSPVRGISVRTSVVPSRRLVPTSRVAPTVPRVPRRRAPPLRALPVRVSRVRARAPVAPAVCPVARRVPVVPVAHRVRGTTRSPPRRAWASRGLPARPAATPRVRADLVRPPAVVVRVVPAAPVGRVPVVAVAVCPACRARTRP